MKTFGFSIAYNKTPKSAHVSSENKSESHNAPLALRDQMPQFSAVTSQDMGLWLCSVCLASQLEILKRRKKKRKKRNQDRPWKHLLSHRVNSQLKWKQDQKKINTFITDNNRHLIKKEHCQ